MNIQMTTITPRMANHFLGENNCNRKLNKRHVKFLADQISNNKWAANGQTIVMAEDGTLMDGQHRLHAIIESNRTVNILLCTGAKKADMSTIDNGKSRTSYDVLTMSGYTNNRLLASSLAQLYRFDHANLARDGGAAAPMPNGLVEAAVEQIDQRVGLDWLVKTAMQISRNTQLNSTHVFSALHLLVVKYGKETVEDFADKLNSGGDYKKSPTSAIPKILARNIASGRKTHRAYIFAMVMVGFERWMRGNEMSVYRNSSVVLDINRFYKTYNTKINW